MEGLLKPGVFLKSLPQILLLDYFVEYREFLNVHRHRMQTQIFGRRLIGFQQLSNLPLAQS